MHILAMSSSCSQLSWHTLCRETPTSIVTMLRRADYDICKCSVQIAINWCICQGTIPIPGAKNVAQMQSNLGALGWQLDSGELAEINAAADKAPRGMLQNIFQTA